MADSRLMAPAPGSYTPLAPKLEASEKSACRRDCDGLVAVAFTWINVLLIFVPLGMVSALQEWSSIYIFSLNFMAIVPLAGILGVATESLAEHTGEVIGGLINATFGNAVEMIITIQAIQNGLVRIVQGSLMGSILSNLLLVLGMAIFFGGLVYVEQEFNISSSSTNHSVLLVASIGMALPVLFSDVPHTEAEDVLTISRFCAIIMACTYLFFLLFQLKTHKYMFEDQGGDEALDEDNEDAGQSHMPKKSLKKGQSMLSMTWTEMEHVNDVKCEAAVESPREVDETGRSVGAADSKHAVVADRSSIAAAVEDDQPPELSIACSVILLLGTTVVIATCSEFLVDSINDVSDKHGVPKAFIGVILLPIVGNAAEHLTAVSAAYKGKMDLALGVAVGSSSQVALFVVPFSVIIGWCYDQPMTLNFRAFDTGVLLLSVFLVASVLQDGSSNWLEGLMLIGTYLMVACICCYIPEEE